MADPVTTPLLIGTTLARTVLDSQAATAEARTLEQQAGVAAALARERAATARRRSEAGLATRRARFAAGGVAPTGSPLEVLEAQAREDELELRTLRWEGALEADELGRRAARRRDARSGALLGSAAELGGSLLDGFALEAPPLRTARHRGAPPRRP